MGLFRFEHILKGCQFLACSIFMLLAVWYFWQGDYLAAAMYASGALATGLLLWALQNPVNNHLSVLCAVLFFLYTLVALVLLVFTWQQSTLLHLSVYLAYPLLAFSLLPFRPALLFVLSFALFTNQVLMLQLDGLLRAAYLIAFWITLLLTSLHAFAQFKRREDLRRQLHRDPATQLFNQHQLNLDLHKEQQRAQRESTYLGLIYIQASKPFNLVAATEVVEQLAAYEGLYSVAPDLLVALLPLAHPDLLHKRKEELRHNLPELNFTAQLNSANQPLKHQAYMQELS